MFGEQHPGFTEKYNGSVFKRIPEKVCGHGIGLHVLLSSQRPAGRNVYIDHKVARVQRDAVLFIVVFKRHQLVLEASQGKAFDLKPPYLPVSHAGTPYAEHFSAFQKLPVQVHHGSAEDFRCNTALFINFPGFA